MKKRPINLDLTTIRFPLPAIVSILHRASGVLVFLFVPILLWLLNGSIASPDSFNAMQLFMQQIGMKFMLWVVISALLFHLVAGVRHLLMDLGIGETLRGGRLGAIIVMVIALMLIIAMGIWLW